MFFIARTVAAMFTGSCGSYSTTTIDARRDSVIRYAKCDQALRLVPVAAEIHELPRPSTEHELPAATLAAARLLVDDDVDADGRRVRGERDEDAVSRRRPLPSRRDVLRQIPALDAADAHRGEMKLGNEHPPRAAV